MRKTTKEEELLREIRLWNDLASLDPNWRPRLAGAIHAYYAWSLTNQADLPETCWVINDPVTVDGEGLFAAMGMCRLGGGWGDVYREPKAVDPETGCCPFCYDPAWR